jgi:hypothetical protein
MKITAVEAICPEEFANVFVLDSVHAFRDGGYRQRVTTAPDIGASGILPPQGSDLGTGLLPGICVRTDAHVTVSGEG